MSPIHDDDGKVCLSKSERTKYCLMNNIRKRPVWDICNFEKDLLERGESPFKCRACSRYLYVDEFGDVHWCSQKRGVFQKPLVDYSFEDLRNQFHKHKGCSTKCTLGCVRTASILGNWRR